MLIKKLPFLSLLLALVMLLSSFVSKQHDQSCWEAIEKHYQGKLYEMEVPIYIDYLSRKFSLAGRNPAHALKSINEAKDNNNTLFVIRSIVKDAEFTNYLDQKGSIFLDNETMEFWRNKRAAIAPLFKETSSQRLGLSPQGFEPQKIITHVFSHSFSYLLILIFISFCIISVNFERTLGHFKLYSYVIISSLTSALSYSFLASTNAPILEGPIALTYGLASAMIVYYCYQIKIGQQVWSRKKITLLFSLLSGACLITYSTLTTLNSPKLFLYLSTTVFLPMLACSLFMYFSLKIDKRELPVNSTLSKTPEEWEYRTELSKALECLSRFEFNAARQILNALSLQYPDSRAILEQRYNLAKLQPEDTHYWKLAKKLIELCVLNKDYERIGRLFNDIQKNTASKKRAQEKLNPEHYHQIMTLFVNQGDLSKAEKAFHFLELGGDKHIILDACKVLIEEFKIRHTTVKQQQYEMLFERLKA